MPAPTFLIVRFSSFWVLSPPSWVYRACSSISLSSTHRILECCALCQLTRLDAACTMSTSHVGGELHRVWTRKKPHLSSHHRLQPEVLRKNSHGQWVVSCFNIAEMYCITKTHSAGVSLVYVGLTVKPVNGIRRMLNQNLFAPAFGVIYFLKLELTCERPEKKKE